MLLRLWLLPVALLLLPLSALFAEDINEEESESQRRTVVIEWGQSSDEEERDQDSHKEEDDEPLWRRFIPARDDEAEDSRYGFGTLTARATGLLSYSELDIEVTGASQSTDSSNQGFDEEFTDEYQDSRLSPGIGIHGNVYLTSWFALGGGIVYHHGPDPSNKFIHLSFPIEALFRFNDRIAATLALGPTIQLYDDEIPEIAYDDVRVAPNAVDEIEHKDGLAGTVGVQVDRLWFGLFFALHNIRYEHDIISWGGSGLQTGVITTDRRDQSVRVAEYRIFTGHIGLGVGYSLF